MGVKVKTDKSLYAIFIKGLVILYFVLIIRTQLTYRYRIMKNFKNAGRKFKYGEPTVAMRIPESLVPRIQDMLDKMVVLEDIFSHPPAVRHIIESMAHCLNRYETESHNALRELITITIENADEKSKPRLLGVLAHYDSIFPEESESLAGTIKTVTGFFDDMIESTKPKLLD